MDKEFSLGDFRVRPQLNEICGPDGCTRLEPKAMAVLVYLVEHEKDLCLRQEILAGVWGDAFVTEEVLTGCIHQIRRALADSARSPRHIETIPKSGYRLISDLGWGAEPAPSHAAAGSNRLRGLRTAILAGALAAVILAGWLVAHSRRADRLAATAEAINNHLPRKIVILPFRTLGETDHDYFAAGISEEIVGLLAGTPSLGVIARSSAAGYDPVAPNYDEIEHQLGADYVLTGTVRWFAGDVEERARVTAKLASTREGMVIWAENYEGTADDAVEVQIRIASEVFRQLDIALDASELEILEQRPTASPAAYRAFLRGLVHANDPDVSSESLARAARLFEDATELDSGFARAFAELCVVRSYAFWLGYVAGEEAIALAREAGERAVELAPDSAHTQVALGYFQYYVSRSYEAALTYFRRAEDKLPGSGEVVGASAWVLRRLGRFDEAIDQIERAAQLDPRAAWLERELGVTYRMVRRYSDAQSAFERSLALSPDQSLAAFDLAINELLDSGDTQRARALLSPSPRHPNDIFGACWIEMLDRDYEAAIERAALFDGVLGPNSWPRALFEGWANSMLGRDEAAREAFERVVAELAVLPAERPSGLAVNGRVRFLASEGANLAWAYAALGREADAMQEMLITVQELPVTKDALWGSDRLIYQAHVLTITGQKEAALREIERLLSMPAEFSVALLELDPRWDSLRDQVLYSQLIIGK